MLVPDMAYNGPADLRPQFHFTAPSGWINDPNGLVYQNGNYHLFYQHNPFGTGWGNMTWGHAISKDLIHWQHLGEAITPDALGTIFSGSAVIDKDNTAGFGKSAMVCFYTAAGGTNDASKGKPFTQCLAWSLDGKSYTKYAKNPVIPHIAGENRDPKVFWHPQTKRWIMALYLDGDHYAILGSPNMTDWTQLSTLTMPETSECPDLFQLSVDGTKTKKWVFWGANGNYMVGEFDGTIFHPDSKLLHSHFGNTGYAAQTYSNAPKGRCIQIPWFRDANFPNCPWNQQLGFPNTLGLRTTAGGPTLTFNPIDEIKSIRSREVQGKDGVYAASSGLLDLESNWTVPTSGDLHITVNGIEITLDRAQQKLRVSGQEALVNLDSGHLNLRVIADRTSLEIYAQNGLVYMPMFVLPKDGTANGVTLKSSAGWVGQTRVFELNVKQQN